jgi:hypothetical protein
MPGRTAFLCVLILAFSLILGCDSPEHQTIKMSNADAGRSVVVEAGDKIEVTLQTIGPGQYGDPLASSGSVMFLGESSADTLNPAGPRQLYRFKAVSPGRYYLTIPHTGDLPAGAAIPAFSVTVEVQ